MVVFAMEANRKKAEEAVLRDFMLPPPTEILNWLVDGYMHLHCKPEQDTDKDARKPVQLKLF